MKKVFLPRITRINTDYLDQSDKEKPTNQHVIPAKAGIQAGLLNSHYKNHGKFSWIPASAGMTCWMNRFVHLTSNRLIFLVTLALLLFNSLNADIVFKNGSKFKGQSSGNGILFDPNGDGIDDIKFDVGGNLLIGGNLEQGVDTARGGLHVAGDAKFTGNIYVAGGTLEEGLIGWWTFDEEDSSGNVIDHSGYGNNGTPTSFSYSTSAVTGKFGKAIDFDGTNDGIYISGSVKDLSEHITISMWINPDSINNNDNFIGTYLSGLGWMLRTSGPSDDDKIEFFNGTSNFTSNSVLVANVWQHIAVTFDGSYYKLYHDGITASAPLPGGAPTNTSSGDLTIGRIPTASFEFPGKIDDVRIYNRALNAKEISELYRAMSSYLGQGGTVSGNITISGNAVIKDTLHFETQASAPSSPSTGEMYSDGANLFFYNGSEWKDTTFGGNIKWPLSSSNISNGGIASDNLVGWWTLDEASGNTVYDLSGQGNDGTTTNVAAGNIGVTGKFGKSIDFDGTDDYVNTTYSQSSGDGTFSAWFKTGGQSSDTGSTWRAIFGQGTISVGGVDPDGIMLLMIRDGAAGHGKVAGVWGEDNTYLLTSDTYIDNIWHHAVLTKTGTTCSFYMDGVLVGTWTSTDSVDDATTSFQIGGSTSHADRKFKGLVDDVRIYNRPLSADEIGNLYSASLKTIVGTSNAPDAILEIDNSSGTNDIFSIRDNSSEVLVVKDGGSVGIGTSSPSYKLEVSGNVKIDNDLILSGNLSMTGNIYVDTTHSYDLGSTSNAYHSIHTRDLVTTSDRRLKAGIKKLNIGLEEILKLKAKRYTFKGQSQEHIGLIAQEVETIIPEAVRNDGTLGVRYFDLVPVLIQSQKEDNDAMEKDIEELRKLIEAEEIVNMKLRLKAKNQ